VSAVSQPDDLPPASERPVPRGVAGVAPFRDVHEYVAALHGLTGVQIAAAIAERRDAGLLDGGAGDATELRVEALRRAAVFDARLAGAQAAGIALPLAGAFDAWQLESDDRVVLGCLLGAELSPAIARGFARLGGVTVETVAAVLRAGDAGVAELVARLAAGTPVSRLALVAIEGTGPLLQRRLVVAPRLLPLALGSRAVDAGLGVELQRQRVATLAVDHADRAGYHALRGVLARDAALPVGVLVAGRGGGAVAIAADAALSLGRAALIVRTIPADRAWCDAVAREALLQHAAVIVDAGGQGLPAPLVRRLMGLPVPVAIACEAIEPALDGLPQLRVELPAADAAAREVLWRAALAGVTAEVDARTLADGARVGAAAITHAVAHARLLADATGRTQLTRGDLADGLAAALSLGPWPRSAGQLEPIVPLAIAERLRAIAARAGDGMIALITGAAGAGKTTMGRALAGLLGIDHVELDAGSTPPVGLEAAFVAVDTGLVVLTLVNPPPSLAARLRRTRGLVILSGEREDDLDPALRRLVRLHVALKPFGKEDRERLWAAALPDLLAGHHAELARDLELTGGQIVAIARAVTAVGEPTIDAIRAAARRLS
jgi:hypothetical protein